MYILLLHLEIWTLCTWRLSVWPRFDIATAVARNREWHVKDKWKFSPRFKVSTQRLVACIAYNLCQEFGVHHKCGRSGCTAKWRCLLVVGPRGGAPLSLIWGLSSSPNKAWTLASPTVQQCHRSIRVYGELQTFDEDSTCCYFTTTAHAVHSVCIFRTFHLPHKASKYSDNSQQHHHQLQLNTDYTIKGALKGALNTNAVFLGC